MLGKPLTTSLQILYYGHHDSTKSSTVAGTSKNFLSVIIDFVETDAGRKRKVFLEFNITEIQEPNTAFLLWSILFQTGLGFSAWGHLFAYDKIWA